MVMMVAMVASTTIPAASHASMNHEPNEKVAYSEIAAAHDHADCDHHAEKTSHDKQATHDKPCCDKGVCKCLNGNCHGGVTMILSKDGDALLAFDVRAAQFTFAHQYSESATLLRMKRPPKV